MLWCKIQWGNLRMSPAICKKNCSIYYSFWLLGDREGNDKKEQVMSWKYLLSFLECKKPTTMLDYISQEIHTAGSSLLQLHRDFSSFWQSKHLTGNSVWLHFFLLRLHLVYSDWSNISLWTSLGPVIWISCWDS